MAYCIPSGFGSIASRRRVPRLLFLSGLHPFFDAFPYLGDVALSPCFRPCLGLFIHAPVVAIWVTLPPPCTSDPLASQSAMTVISNDMAALVGFGCEAFFYGAFPASAGKTS
jgi:hypothetical protein